MELGFVPKADFLLIFISLTRAFQLIPLVDDLDLLSKWIGDPEPEATPDGLREGGYVDVKYGDPITCEELHSIRPIFEEELPDPTLNDPNHFQGDIRAKTMEELLWMMGKVPMSDSVDGTYRSAFLDYRKRWPNNTIPYIISNEFNEAEREKIGRAMQAYHTYTCIRFRPMVPHRDQNWIHIKKGKGCYSFIGMKFGEQPVSLGKNCVQHGVILHELMHAVGFYHEQMRHDRDDFVSIDLTNVRKKFWVNFGKNSVDNSTNLGLPYDFSSVMHYKRNSFGPGSIESKPPNIPFGQRKGFSRIDVQGIARLYGCDVPVFTKLRKPRIQKCKDKDPEIFCKNQIRDFACDNPNVAEKCKKSCGLCNPGGGAGGSRHQSASCESQPPCGSNRKGKCRSGNHCWSGELQENSGQNPCSVRTCMCCVTGKSHAHVPLVPLRKTNMYLRAEIKSCIAPKTPCGTLKQGICRPYKCPAGEFPSPVASCEGTNCKCCKPKTELCSAPGQACGPYNGGKCRSKCMYWEQAENCKACHCPGRYCQCCYASTYKSNDIMQNLGSSFLTRRSGYFGRDDPIWVLLGMPKKTNPTLDWLSDDDLEQDENEINDLKYDNFV